MLRDQIFRAVESMEARVRELRTQRTQDLAELATLTAVSSADGGEDEANIPVTSTGSLDADEIRTEKEKVNEEAPDTNAEHE